MVQNKCTEHAAPGVFCPLEKKLHRDWG